MQFTRDDFWVITNDLLSPAICGQLDDVVPSEQVVCEPAARNTAPAAGLAAFLVEKTNPDAVLGIFPADHVIADEAAFLGVLEHAIKIAAAGENMVVLGVTPTRPETGYGYIETGNALDDGSLRVRRFTEKPNHERAEEFVAAFRRYADRTGLFVPIAEPLPQGRRGRVALTLKDGRVWYERPAE